VLQPSWALVAAPAATALSGADSFTLRFTPSLPGTYRLRLGVGDGAATGTADVEVQVGLPPNRAPSLTCPSEISQVVGQPVVMTCAATDDSLPLGASLTPSWQFVSGPATPELTGNWTFSTRFTPTTPGTYRWRLHVSDSELSGTVDIVVEVEPPPNQAPVLACPAAVTGVAGSQVTMACSVSDDGLPAGNAASVDWFITAAQTGITLEGYTALTAHFVPPVAGTYRFRVQASDSVLSSAAEIVVTVTPPPNAAPQVQCAPAATGIVGQSLSITCTATDDGQPAGAVLAPSWRVVSAPAAVTLGGANSLRTTFTPSVAGSYALRLTVGDSALQGTADVSVTIAPPPNVAPQLSCPSRISTRMGDTTRISCGATDDGLPAGSALSLSWSWASAPASPVLDPDAASVSFTPNASGTYRLRLAASDGLLDASAEVEIVVASAGPLRLQALGASTTQGYGGQQSYRYRLWTKLVDVDAPVDLVGSLTNTQGGAPSYPDYRGRSFDRDHEGHSGFTVAQIASGLPEWMNAYVPDVSLIHVGTNDMLFGGGTAVSQALGDMTQLVQRLRERQANVRIFVARILPVDPQHPGWYLSGDFSGAPARIASYNSQLPAWAASLSTSQSPIVVVDQNSGFDARAQTIDGIHPNASGEEFLAQRWFDAIRSLF
jgi:lysophospholipase L1-like esterase